MGQGLGQLSLILSPRAGGMECWAVSWPALVLVYNHAVTLAQSSLIASSPTSDYLSTLEAREEERVVEWLQKIPICPSI